MTTQTMPGRPKRDTSLRPLPWRRMAWVTWRQHRLALAGVVAVFGAPGVYLLITGLPIHNAYTAVTACHPAGSAICQQLAQNFVGAHVHDVLVTAGLMQTIPVLVGAFVGAPLLAREFEAGLTRAQAQTDVKFAVENLYPLRAGNTEVAAYAPNWNPVELDVDHVTLDLSHTAVSGSDALEMADDLGQRLAHVHLADGTRAGLPDEHLIPGRGSQPCGPLLERLHRMNYSGMVVVEISTRRALSPQERYADLEESLAFAREHLRAASAVG